MPVTIAGLNTLDFLKGALAQIDVFNWTSGRAAIPSPLTSPGGKAMPSSLGAARDIGISLSRDVKFVEADNALSKLDAYYTGFDAEVKFTLVQANLQKFSLALGESWRYVADTIVGDPGSSVGLRGTPYFDATLPVDEPMTRLYFCVVFTVTGQSFQSNMVEPVFGQPTADIYTRRRVCFWKCSMTAKLDQAYKKGEEVLIPFVMKPLVDSTVTYVQGSIGRIGMIEDAVV